ncbi:hypothetical protein P168DRAFT_316476 [Aspergillus campestris IBT 28561]|uniref:Uncharacterized protein n=1 Tax=Aspergillus campestris (strain IBT 28561) TaxID=1392248 RepID=A0A2I1D9A6_ASPC2|nr:uncharacterized protein P168DRAFT_316476 [Aspergillus campestris IBT 28561]PKY06471.1 hypothetical protein P168DRAFT_316476 [Aspergillus campestris IBT 28561]
MPSVAIVGTAPAPPEHLDRSLFRSHKALPRKTHVLQTVQCLPIKPAGQDGNPGRDAVPPTAPSLPLTPPRVSHEDTRPNDGNKQNVVSPSVIEGLTSPKPSHPPTPESTPPRRTPTNRRPGLSHGGRSSCSSREDSFQTAREMFSDSEPDTPGRSVQCLLPKTFRRSEARTPEPKARADRTASTGSPKPKSRPSARARRAGNPEPSTVTSARAQPSAHQTAPRASDLASSSEGPVPSLSIEQFREQVGWPSGGGAGLPEPDDSRRSSGISTASTVEVMIIDPPPPGTSERASTSSHSDAHHRLVRKIGRISDSDRRSIASEISASEMSTFGGVASPQVEVVPVVVIPERRSSLKSSVQSSAPSSRDPSKVDSSRRSRRRSGSRTESLDQSRSRRRTRSPSSARSTQSAFGHPVVPPRSSSLSAPTSRNNSRSTSLTSESLRHHTLAMDAVPSQPQKPQKLGREFSSTDVPRTQSILIGLEDTAHLHSPAVTATHPSFPSLSPGPIEINEAITVAFFPHNNESILLVDPQVREQAERQASQLYQETTEPRTPEMQMQCNAESPLVNPRSPPEPPACKVIPPTVSSATDLTPATTNLSRAPTILGPAGPHLSPAATNLTPTATNLSRTATNDTNPGPFRRVASARRPRIRPGSESFHSFIRSLSLRSAENRKAGQEIDHSLHPFWRPRRFWPESSEPEDDSPREESMRFRDTDPDNVISNSLGMPQQRVAFNGPPPPSPHRPAPRPSDITIPYSAATNRHTVETSVFSPEAFRSQTSFHQDRFRSVSWWRLRLRLGNVRNLRKRLRRTFQKRAEGKREARREKLKQSIGEMKPLGSSTRGIAQWWHGLPDNS